MEEFKSKGLCPECKSGEIIYKPIKVLPEGTWYSGVCNKCGYKIDENILKPPYFPPIED